MVSVRMRYVTKRAKAKGRVIWYWQRPGHKLTRLPDDEVARYATQARLNAEADKVHAEARKGNGKQEAPRGTLKWVIDRYKESDGYVSRPDSTRRVYGYALKWFDENWGFMPASVIDHELVLDLANSLRGQMRKRGLYIAVLSNLFKEAIRRKVATSNPTRELGLTHPKSRQEIFCEADINAFIAASQEHARGAIVRRGFWLLLYTAQRPGDMLKMTWADWNGSQVKVIQQKTAAKVDVWCHRDLRDVLEAAEAGREGHAHRHPGERQAVPVQEFQQGVRRGAPRRRA
jgi:integrase